jgi:RNA polymerase sigma factor (sigma-70 family)
MGSGPSDEPGDKPADEKVRPRGRFVTTHWSMVLAAGGDRSGASAEALAELCTEYWYPLYAYVRRRGYDPDDARDLTQAFFLKLLQNDDLTRADPARGRFRTFLQTALKHFLASEWRRATAQKRGGDTEILELDFRTAEELYRIEPASNPNADYSPETLYARRWALGLLDSALEELRAEYDRAGKVELFEALKGAVGGEAGTLPYVQLAQELGQSEGALRTATSRLRRRFRDRIRSRVAQTVARDEDVDDEIRHLFAALA